MVNLLFQHRRGLVCFVPFPDAIRMNFVGRVTRFLDQLHDRLTCRRRQVRRPHPGLLVVVGRHSHEVMQIFTGGFVIFEAVPGAGPEEQRRVPHGIVVGFAAADNRESVGRLLALLLFRGA